MKNTKYNPTLLLSVSAATLLALYVSPASATVTFNVGSDTITSAGSGNTTVSGNTATTSSSGDAIGALMTGSSAGAFTWNFNGNVTGSGFNYGLEVATSGGGTNNINVGSGVTIQGASTADGIIFSDTAASDHLINMGTIIGGAGDSGVDAYQDTALTVDNHGSIIGGSGNQVGILQFNAGGYLTTLNNYHDGTVSGNSGASAIVLDSATTNTTINTAGTITGDIHLGSTTGNGDIVNIYGGTINGSIHASNSSGSYGTVNFDLIGGTFGTGGTSVDGTFSTGGDIGSTSTLLKAVNINSGTVTLNNEIRSTTTTIANGATLKVNATNETISNSLVNNGTLNLQNFSLTADNISGSGTITLGVTATTSGHHGYITDTGGTVNLSSMTVDPVFAGGAVVTGENLLVVSDPGALSFGASNTITSSGFSWTLSQAGSSGTDYQGISYDSGDLLITAATASNQVTFNIASDSITTAGSGHTTAASNVATTNGGGDAFGALMTGSNAGTFTWNFNGNVTGDGVDGLQVETSGGGHNIININGVTIQGDSGTSGILFDDSAASDHLTNTGSIIGGSTGTGIQIEENTALTIDNHGAITAGTGLVEGIFEASTGVLTTLNNYSDGTITGHSGAPAITLENTSSSATINNAGTISGNIQLGSITGSGDTVNVYGGTINGAIKAADNSGSYGTVNFNLVGGTFGTGGTSGSGTFATNGDLGSAGNMLHAVNINSGTLTLNNNIRSTSTTIANGATLSLGANESISNSLVDNGTLDLQAHALTTTNISGSGTLRASISGGANGYIIGSGGGTINLNGIAFNLSSIDTLPATGSKILLVSDPGTLTFNSANFSSANAFTSFSASQASGSGTDMDGHSYNTGDLLLTATRDASSLITAVVNSSPAGQSLVQAFTTQQNTLSGNALALLTSLGSMTNNEQAETVARLTNTSSSSATHVATQVASSAISNISTRMGSISFPAAIASNDASSGMAAGGASGNKSVWMQAIGSAANEGTISNQAGFNSNTYGTIFGADKEFTDNMRLGAAFTYANTRVDNNGNLSGNTDSVDSYLGSLYGKYTMPKWYVTGIVNYGVHTVDTTRLITLPSLAVAQGAFSEQQYGTNLEAGYPLWVKSFTVTPFAGFGYDHIHQDSYTESGGGIYNLTVNGTDTNSYRSTLGTRMSKEYALNSGWKLEPTINLGWTHEFNNHLVPTQTEGFSDGSLSFAAPGVQVGRNAFDFGATADLVSAQSLTLSAGYQGEIRDHYTSNSGMLKARFTF